ncbi:MAG: helix-turn-helix domain-containing protein [Patescibacteria group bacterium]
MSLTLTVYHHNGVCLIVEAGIVEVLGRRVKLTRTQFVIFHLLMSQPETVLTRNQIMDWLEEKQKVECLLMFRSIDTQIRRLRKRLFPRNPKLGKLFIGTVVKRGYRLNDLRQKRQS